MSYNKLFSVMFSLKVRIVKVRANYWFYISRPLRVELSSLLESPTYGIEHRLTGRSCWYINSDSPHSNTTISFVEFTTIPTN
ncbi:hypothetical protein PRUPE_7G236900 [Prunus persica]|uniref:Uncharacterized protein n=1 Tax=Prunus persica TaxID=3760 RepID=A0A251NFZ5_PRUPE|nr:hypothetical protein PRUPE_7G236900 [Prunus persica]